MKKTYLVTEAAGLFVAGQRSPGAGKSLLLTGRQAEHPKRLGHIVEAPDGDAPKAAGRRAKVADA